MQNVREDLEKTREKVLKVAISWAKGEHDELIDKKVVWWESWLIRKLID